MDIVGATKLDGRFGFYEAHYLFFVLDLDSRLDNTVEPCRPGVGVVTKNNALDYIEFMRQFAVDIADFKNDFDSLEDDELVDARFDFLPTVLIDFDNEAFLSSHPESDFLNFEGFLPPHWIYERVCDVSSMIPGDQSYWSDWKRLKGAF